MIAPTEHEKNQKRDKASHQQNRVNRGEVRVQVEPHRRWLAVETHFLHGWRRDDDGLLFALGIGRLNRRIWRGVLAEALWHEDFTWLLFHGSQLRGPRFQQDVHAGG